MERKKTITEKLNRGIGSVMHNSATAWKKIRKDKAALAAGIIAAMLFLLAVFCYFLIPDNTTNANRVCLPIGNQPPGFEITMLRIIQNKPMEHQGFISRLIYGNHPDDSYIPIGSSYFEGNEIVVKEFSASGDSSF